MKKILILLVCVCFLFLSSACGGSGNEPGENDWLDSVDYTFESYEKQQEFYSVFCKNNTERFYIPSINEESEYETVKYGFSSLVYHNAHSTNGVNSDFIMPLLTIEFTLTQNGESVLIYFSDILKKDLSKGDIKLLQLNNNPYADYVFTKNDVVFCNVEVSLGETLSEEIVEKFLNNLFV